MILNRSNHPVYVKRINLLIWSLRDELEAAIAKRLEETTSGEPNLEDLKIFYGRPRRFYAGKDVLKSKTSSTNSNEDDENESSDETELDPSGNPMDNDAMAMMAAVSGDEETAEDTKEAETGTDAEAEAATSETNTTSAPEKKTIDPQTFMMNRIHPDAGKLAKGFALINDLDMDSFLFFSRNGFNRGQTIVVELVIPRRFTLTAEVIKCENISRRSRVISDEKPNFRIHAILTYNQPGEREALRSFLKSVEPDIPPPPKKLKKPDDGGDDDEFEDLGF